MVTTWKIENLYVFIYIRPIISISIGYTYTPLLAYVSSFNTQRIIIAPV